MRIASPAFQKLKMIKNVWPKRSKRILEELYRKYDAEDDVPQNLNEDFFEGFECAIGLVEDGMREEEADCPEEFDEFMEGFSVGAGIFGRSPALHAGSGKQKWTLCDEKPPKQNEYVWVTDVCGNVDVRMMTDCGNGPVWFDRNRERKYSHELIVAWMPYIKPEPYHGFAGHIGIHLKETEGKCDEEGKI